MSRNYVKIFEFEFPGIFNKGTNTIIYVILLVHKEKGFPRLHNYGQVTSVNPSSLICKMGQIDAYLPQDCGENYAGQCHQRAWPCAWCTSAQKLFTPLSFQTMLSRDLFLLKVEYRVHQNEDFSS